MGTVYAKEVQGEMETIGGSEDDSMALSDVKVKVHRIHIDGLGRTKDDIITRQVKDVFQASTFEELIKRTQQARGQMMALGLFKHVKVFIDTSKDESAGNQGYEVFYEVKELRRVAGGISTMVGTNDGSLLFSLKLPNALGRGERISAEYTYGTKSTTGQSVLFSKPVGGNPNINFQAGSFQYSGDYPWTGYKETDRGVHAEILFPSMFGDHSIRWEGIWRELSTLPTTSSFTVREQSGHSLKSSLKHQWVRDTRDDKVIPNEGYLVRISQELAGLGGTAKFVKHDAEVQINRNLFWDMVFQVTANAGFMKSLQPLSTPHIIDRFYLGGPLTLRGFSFKGVGPHEEGSALGGDAFCLSGAHLYTPLPFIRNKGGFGELFRTHLFISAGNLTNIDLNTDPKENLRRLANTMRLSYGAGVVLRMGGIARLELNYCVPFKSEQGDSLNPGLQFGIGIHFL